MSYPLYYSLPNRLTKGKQKHPFVSQSDLSGKHFPQSLNLCLAANNALGFLACTNASEIK